MLIIGFLALSAGTGCGARSGSAETSAEPARAAARPSASVPAAVRKFRSVQEAAPVAAPTRIRIPELGVDSTFELLGRAADQTIEVPQDWQRAGWYEEGPRPGEPGSAVILGHVDSPQGRAVFTGLGKLAPGTKIHIDRADGSTVTFSITRIEQHLRAAFPTDEVYLPTVEPELRLITCGGAYIKSRGGYQSNVIAFATADV